MPPHTPRPVTNKNRLIRYVTRSKTELKNPTWRESDEFDKMAAGVS